MPASINAELQDAAIRHQIYIGRLGGGVAARMLNFLARADQRIVERLLTAPDRVTTSRLNDLLIQIREIQRQLQKQIDGQLAGELADIAEFEINHLNRQFAKIESSVDFSPIDAIAVRAVVMSQPFSGTHLRWATTGEHVDELFRRRIKLVESEIKMAYVQGDSISQMVRRIRGTSSLGYSDGVLPMSYRAAESIARTATTHIAARAREAYYKEQDAIKKVRWLSILDNRTCIVCMSRDGMEYVPGEKAQRPPAHANCRCTISPVLDQRIAGPLPDLPTYGQWLRTQPRAFVEEVLGQRRAALYLSGKLELSRFVDRKGQILNLEQLAQKYGV